MPVRVSARRVVSVGGACLAGVSLANWAVDREAVPRRHPSIFNWFNIAADKAYYYCGRQIRLLRDAESAHVDAIRVAAFPRPIRGLLGLLPPQFDYSNLHCEPFNREMKQTDSIESQGGATRGSAGSTKSKHLHFPNPIGLAAGFDKNAEVAQ